MMCVRLHHSSTGNQPFPQKHLGAILHEADLISDQMAQAPSLKVLKGTKVVGKSFRS